MRILRQTSFMVVFCALLSACDDLPSTEEIFSHLDALLNGERLGQAEAPEAESGEQVSMLVDPEKPTEVGSTQYGSTVIYKCEVNGEIVFTNQPCAGVTTEVELSQTNIMEKQDYQFKADPSLYTQAYSSSEWYDDLKGYHRALKISQEKNAPILIYGYTDWCPYCRKLEDLYFADPRVAKKMRGFVKVRINPEHSDADDQLFKSWGGKGYPTLWVQQGFQNQPKKSINYRNVGKDNKMQTSIPEFIAELEEELELFMARNG